MKNEYDAWLIWSPTYQCNLQCKYCTTRRSGSNTDIDVERLINTLNKTNKIFRINFIGGGEPFLIENLIDVCEQLTKKHYVGFVTNLTSNQIKNIDRLNLDKVIRIGASFQIEELEKRNLLDKYFENFLFCKKLGIDIIATIVAYPAIFEKIRTYVKMFKEEKMEYRIAAFQGEYNNKHYPNAYTKEEIEEFGFQNEINEFHNYQEPCNAGYNVVKVLPNGDTIVCNKIKEKIGNVYTEINFRKVMAICPKTFCGCPTRRFDPYLFDKAMKECI